MDEYSGEIDGPSGRAGRPESSGRGFALGFLAVLVAGVLWVAASCISGGSAEPAEPTEYEARAVCEDWVTERLKAPATAQFTHDATTGTAAGGYTITGAVDAENGFGALVRSEWTCEIQFLEDADEWRGSATLN